MKRKTCHTQTNSRISLGSRGSCFLLTQESTGFKVDQRGLDATVAKEGQKERGEREKDLSRTQEGHRVRDKRSNTEVAEKRWRNRGRVKQEQKGRERRSCIRPAITGCGVSIIHPCVPEGSDQGDVAKVQEMMMEAETLPMMEQQGKVEGTNENISLCGEFY